MCVRVVCMCACICVCVRACVTWKYVDKGAWLHTQDDPPRGRCLPLLLCYYSLSLLNNLTRPFRL